MKKLRSYWYLAVIFGFMLIAALVYLIFGEGSVIAVHDNLDLFIPQFQMMKNEHSFWSHGSYAPFLGGISRDVLPSEFSLYSMLYMIMPSFAAYITGYFVKIVIAIASSILLGREVLQEDYADKKALVWMCGFAYGLLNVFPTFGIPFASIPLVIFLLLRIMRKPSFGWYAALFFYPLVSYFSYFGLFILAYMMLAFVILWMKNKKIPWRMLLAVFVLSLGFIVFEYRLFYMMLFDDTVTIRSSIEAGSYGWEQIFSTIGESFIKGMFHAESVHTWLVLPVCMIYFFYLNISYLVKKNAKGIFHDWYNLLMLILVFNSVVYGIYYWEPLRNFVEMVCPPLTGWQFNRTIFFNPFVWYCAFFVVLLRLYKTQSKKWRIFANVLVLGSVLVILFSGTRYNDLYNTCVNKAYELVKGQHAQALTYEEFYSPELFEKAKEDIDYRGQWSAAYGFYPATLEYNGISTLDGYLGFYSQSYKEEFRKMIEPAIERVEESRDYFDSWGARAYLYSGTEVSIVNASRNYEIAQEDLYLNLNQFKKMGGRYLFSRIEISNAQEAGLTLAGVYTDENSPYTLYVYQTTSRYQEVAHADISYQEMQKLTYEEDLLNQSLEQLTSLAEDAANAEEALEPEKMQEMYQQMLTEMEKLMTCNALAQLNYYHDVFDVDNQTKQAELLDKAVDYGDKANVAIRELCKSPYKDIMIELLSAEQVEAYIDYEEMSEEEKKLVAKENGLEQEYEQLASEDFSFDYQGEEWNLERLGQEGASVSAEDYIQIYQGIYREKNAAVGEVYLELIQVRNQIAELNGYDNYADYAYEEVYVRDYTLKQAKKLLKEMRRKVAPVANQISAHLYDMDYQQIYYGGSGQSSTEIIQKIGPFLEKIDPELKETQEHFLNYELYDMDTSSTKADTAFTIGLSYFHDGFIYGKMYDNYLDFYNVIHEFGHYNNTYRSADTFMESSNNIDVCEIHSQGMQMLFYDYYEELLGDEVGPVYAYYDVSNMAGNAVQAALISEFEIEVYENPDMSLQELNELYLKLSKRYGMYYTSEIKELYNWCDVPHLFTSPCYYISYLTSAFSSLDLLTMAEEDRYGAVETYMTLTTIPGYIPYCSAVEYAGLRDIFEKGVASEIMKETAEILEVE